MRSRKELADAIRILSMDAVDKAKSGHPARPWAWPTWRKPVARRVAS